MDKLSPDELKVARTRYLKHKGRCATKRDAHGEQVEMRLTFEEWLHIWLSSGHWHERGIKSGQYCMARYQDLGHYEVGNVEIITCNQNARDFDTSRRQNNGQNTNWAGEQGSAFMKNEHLRRKEMGWINPLAGEAGSKRIKESTVRQLAEGRHQSQLKYICPHCGKEGVGNVMKRNHFDRCKLRST